MVLSGGGWGCLGSVFFMENAWLFSSSRCIPMSCGTKIFTSSLRSTLIPNPKAPIVSALDLPLSIYPPSSLPLPPGIHHLHPPFYVLLL